MLSLNPSIQELESQIYFFFLFVSEKDCIRIWHVVPFIYVSFTLRNVPDESKFQIWMSGTALPGVTS